MHPRQAKGEVKTSLWLPEELWKRAKVRAVEGRVDLRDVIIAALETYLGRTKGERMQRRRGGP